MKPSDFANVININDEYKEYRRMEQNKSERFYKYTDWEKHILSLVSGFSNQDDLHNFKAHCFKLARSGEVFSETAFGFLALLYAVVLGFLTTKGFFWMILYVIPVYIIFGYVQKIRNKRFYYLDILAVVEEYEENLKQKS